MTSTEIILKLPYKKPFLFVDEITEISEKGVSGNYTYRDDEFFYQGHFKENPITPGVILTETMAQIGVVCLGIYLMESQKKTLNKPKIALTSHQVDFYLPVLPNEKVTVVSEKVYFRFQKLKCEVKMYNQQEKMVCKGTISGMIIETN